MSEAGQPSGFSVTATVTVPSGAPCGTVKTGSSAAGSEKLAPGMSVVHAYTRLDRGWPGVAVMSTGSELVDVSTEPSGAQIRNSNSYQLLAHCATHHLRAKYLGIAPDERAATKKMIEEGLQADVLVTTGGVSVGEHDHVGGAFKELGVELFFNKVAIKPGKPMTFGRRGETLVFGLPGNPVAAFVCFHLFVMTAIRQRLGAAEPLPRWLSLPLAADEKSGGDRTTFKPGRLVEKNDGTWVEPIDWHGSGHLAGLVGIDGFFVQKPNEELAQGQRVTFYPV